MGFNETQIGLGMNDAGVVGRGRFSQANQPGAWQRYW